MRAKAAPVVAGSIPDEYLCAVRACSQFAIIFFFDSAEAVTAAIEATKTLEQNKDDVRSHAVLVIVRVVVVVATSRRSRFVFPCSVD